MENQVELEQEHCPHCGHSMKAYKYKVAPIMIAVLIKMKRAAMAKGGGYVVDVIRDMDGTPNELKKCEWSQLSKMRFHGLVAKHRENGKHKAAHWIITERAGKFLRGEVAIPEWVKVFHNQVIEHSPDLVNVGMVSRSTPYVQALATLQWETMHMQAGPDGQFTFV